MTYSTHRLEEFAYVTAEKTPLYCAFMQVFGLRSARHLTANAETLEAGP